MFETRNCKSLKRLCHTKTELAKLNINHSVLYYRIKILKSITIKKLYGRNSNFSAITVDTRCTVQLETVSPVDKEEKKSGIVSFWRPVSGHSPRT